MAWAKQLRNEKGTPLKKQIGNLGKQDGFQLPIVSSIDLKEERKILDEIEEETTQLAKEHKRLQKKWDSKTFPNFRLTGEYLYANAHKGQISKNQMCRDLNLNFGTLTSYISQLCRFDGYALRWIASGSKPDYIQVQSYSQIDFDKWNKRNTRGLISRTKRIMDTRSHAEKQEEVERFEELKTTSAKKISDKIKGLITR